MKNVFQPLIKILLLKVYILYLMKKKIIRNYKNNNNKNIL